MTMYHMNVDFQFHPWRFIIHPPETEEEEENKDVRQGDRTGNFRNFSLLHCNMFSENLMVPFSLEVSTADITLSDIITNMMEEEEDATKAQAGRDED